jgi:hypothetical protein
MKSIALGALLLLAAWFPATARAQQGVFPRSYDISCKGTACTTTACSASIPVEVVGRIQLNTPATGVGSIAINTDYSNVLSPWAANPFAVRIVNGTASATGAGGNSIPLGCFTASFIVPNLKYLANTYGCYSETEHQFDLVPAVKGSGVAISCHATEM